MVIPIGTPLEVRLASTISSETAHPGDHFEGALDSPVLVGGVVAIPAGAPVEGHVAMVRPPGRASGRALLQLAYDRIQVNGKSYDLETRGRQYEGKSGRGTDAALIGGGAVAGGILGGILGNGGGDIAKGAIIGGTAGGAAALVKRGPQLTLPPGTVLTVRLDTPLTVEKP